MPNNILSCKKEDFFHLAETILQQGNCIRFRAEGRSMWPSIRSGDIIKVSPDTDDITVGDIILYRSRENTAVVHRVVKRDSRNILTRGDSSLDLDMPIINEQVLGKVVEIEKRGLHIRYILSEILHYIQGFRLYGALAKIILKPKDIIIEQTIEKDSDGSGDSLERGGKTTLKWTAKKGNLVAGSVDLFPLEEEKKTHNSVWIMSSLWVHYRYRRIGLGKRLTKEVLDYLNNIGANEVRLSVLPSNKAAIRMYEYLGFMITADNHHNPEFEKLIHLKKDVKDPSCHTSQIRN